MIKDDLKEYQKRKQLIAGHRAELDGDMTTSDSVTGSMVEYPYTERVITIQGRNIQREKWLRGRIRVLQRQCARAEKFVDGVEDEHMQALLRLHFIEGYSWPKVRKKLRVRNVTSDCLRMRVANFFRSMG